MEQRQHAVDHVVRADVTFRGATLIEVRLQTAVCEHRRPGRARSTAGEHQRRELRVVDVDDVDRRCREQVVESDDPVGVRSRFGHDGDLDRRHGCPVDVRPVDGTELVDHNDPRVDDDQLGLQFGPRARRVEWHGDRAQADRGKVSDREVREFPTTIATRSSAPTPLAARPPRNAAT